MKGTSISKRTFIITVVILSCIIVAVGVLAIVSFMGNENDVPKDYDMSGITFKDSTVEYDGNEHALEIIGTLPHGVIVNYTPNKLTEVGALEVTASFTGAAMYNPIPSMTATLTITKGTYDMSGVTFGNATLPYDGQEHVLTINGDLPEGVTANYTANRLTDIGSVEVTASFVGDGKNYNAIPSMTATLTIVKGTYDMSGVTFSSVTRPYDGLEHMLVIDGQLPEGVSVSYTPNKLTEIGFLEVTATFTYDSEHYNAITTQTATLTIVKATHDMSGIAFEDKTFSYDGNQHTLEISGELPDGVSVSYTKNTLTEIGSIEVTASFVYDKIHYNEIPDRTATLTVDGDGKYHNVTFIIDDDNSQSIMVEHGSSIKDIPEIPQKTGYDGEWDKALTNITEDLTVNINYIPKQYTITYIPNGGYIKERTQTVTYGELFVLHEATKVGHTPHYMVDNEEIDSGIWKTDGNITVSLDWEANKYKMTYVFNGVTVIEDYATYGTEYTVPQYVLETCEAENWVSGTDSYTPNSKFNVAFTAEKKFIANIVHFADDYKVSISEGNATITKYTGSEIDVVIPDRVKVDGQNYNVTAIAEEAFKHKTTIKSLLVPSGIMSVGSYAFQECYYLETVYWNTTACAAVSSDAIFWNCISLTTAVIGDNVETVPAYAFSNCKSLTSVTIPESVTSIGSYAFHYCLALTSITIPTGVTSIGDSVFGNCSNLEIVYWNATACMSAGKDEYNNIFMNCNKFTSVVIGDNVTAMPAYAFYSSYKLKNVYYNGDIASWCGIEFGNSSANPLLRADNLYINNQLVTDIIIPDGVMSIENNAFYNCSSLTSVTIGNSVTRIGDYAFSGCSSLTSIEIPNSVTSIGKGAFRACSSLTSIEIPNGVTSIGNYAYYGCSNIETVYWNATACVSAGDNNNRIFYGCDRFINVVIGDNVASIPRYAFYNCGSLTSVYYKGTASKWNEISIGSYNSALTSATRYYYSETEPPLNSEGTDYDGNYWYEDEGNIVVWKKES